MHISTDHRPPPDALLTEIAEYVANPPVFGEATYETARLCLMDSLGCGFLAQNYPDCRKLLGPVVPGAVLPGGVRIPGTRWELEPVQAAFNIGAMIRWLDYNDTWLAAEWGHPSDNLGGILAAADYISRQRLNRNEEPLTVEDILRAAIQAHEIQGVLALENSFNRVGLDHVLLVRIASTAVCTGLLGGSKAQITDAVSNAWVDAGCLRTYRHAPNTGSRKSWAAGDATSRAVRLALITLAGEMGYPTALTAKTWGFQDSVFRSQTVQLARSLSSYVMDNVLFKISYPAEFHAQTAVEAAVKLHPQLNGRIHQISRIVIETHESAIRIIDKKGPLSNPADRDHCLQYMVAVPLIFGTLNADHYLDETASDTRIDQLREKMETVEVPAYSKDYLDPEKRSIANAITVHFQDGSATERIEVEYPIGHPRRRAEGLPILEKKFSNNLAARFDKGRCEQIQGVFADSSKLRKTSVPRFMDLFVTDNPV